MSRKHPSDPGLDHLYGDPTCGREVQSAANHVEPPVPQDLAAEYLTPEAEHERIVRSLGVNPVVASISSPRRWWQFWKARS